MGQLVPIHSMADYDTAEAVLVALPQFAVALRERLAKRMPGRDFRRNLLKTRNSASYPANGGI